MDNKIDKNKLRLRYSSFIRYIIKHQRRVKNFEEFSKSIGVNKLTLNNVLYKGSAPSLNILFKTQ